MRAFVPSLLLKHPRSNGLQPKRAWSIYSAGVIAVLILSSSGAIAQTNSVFGVPNSSVKEVSTTLPPPIVMRGINYDVPAPYFSGTGTMGQPIIIPPVPRPSFTSLINPIPLGDIPSQTVESLQRERPPVLEIQPRIVQAPIQQPMMRVARPALVAAPKPQQPIRVINNNYNTITIRMAHPSASAGNGPASSASNGPQSSAAVQAAGPSAAAGGYPMQAYAKARVNLRACPSLKCPVIRQAEESEALTLSTCGRKWCRTEINHQAHFVSRKYVGVH